jgi:hypothetical protein
VPAGPGLLLPRVARQLDPDPELVPEDAGQDPHLGHHHLVEPAGAEGLPGLPGSCRPMVGALTGYAPGCGTRIYWSAVPLVGRKGDIGQLIGRRPIGQRSIPWSVLQGSENTKYKYNGPFFSA